MSDGWIAAFFGFGIAGWTYAQLVRRSGNATPSSTYIAAGGVGVLAAIVIYTLFKYILNV